MNPAATLQKSRRCSPQYPESLDRVTEQQPCLHSSRHIPGSPTVAGPSQTLIGNLSARTLLSQTRVCSGVHMNLETVANYTLREAQNWEL